MKRLLFIMFTLLVAVTLLAACGDTEVTTDGGATTTTTEGSTTTTTEGGTVTTTEPEADDPTPPVTEYETFILNDKVDAYLNGGAGPSIVDWIEFTPNWRYNKNYTDRFIAGDEHWVGTNILEQDEVATCTITFFGTSIALYGHTCPDGGKATITLDGVVLDEAADFYTASRVEALNGKHSGTLLPFFVSDELENTTHTLVVTFVHSEKATEIGMDYAIVTRIKNTAPSIIE